MGEREKLIEVMARAMCGSEGFNPESGRASDGSPLWRQWIPQAQAALAALEAAGVRLVPKHQTEDSVVAVAKAMRDAYGKHECIPWEQSKTRAAWKICARFGYHAMLAASPYAPNGGDGE